MSVSPLQGYILWLPLDAKNTTLAELIMEKQALCLPWLILFSLASIKPGRLMHT